MPKKSSCKKPALVSENLVVKDNGPSPNTKKPCNAIDEIFSTKKRKKSELKKVEKQVEDESTKSKKPKKKENKETEKESSSVKHVPNHKNPAVEDDGPFPTPKKRCNEIDEIFSTKKRKKLEQEKALKQAEDESAKAKKPKKKKNREKEVKEKEYWDPPSRPRKKTGDRLVIYTEEELGFGKSDAGGTPLCPFDCDCCF